MTWANRQHVRRVHCIAALHCYYYNNTEQKYTCISFRKFRPIDIALVLVEGISIILHDGNSKMLYLMLMFDQDTMVDLCILSSIYQIPLPTAQAVSPAVQLTDDKQIRDSTWHGQTIHRIYHFRPKLRFIYVCYNTYI